MKRRMLRCHELEIESNIDCNCEIDGNTEEELYRNMIDHAWKEHDLRHKDLTPRLKEQIMNLISRVD